MSQLSATNCDGRNQRKTSLKNGSSIENSTRANGPGKTVERRKPTINMNSRIFSDIVKIVDQRVPQSFDQHCFSKFGGEKPSSSEKMDPDIKRIVKEKTPELVPQRRVIIKPNNRPAKRRAEESDLDISTKDHADLTAQDNEDQKDAFAVLRQNASKIFSSSRSGSPVDVEKLATRSTKKSKINTTRRSRSISPTSPIKSDGSLSPTKKFHKRVVWPEPSDQKDRRRTKVGLKKIQSSDKLYSDSLDDDDDGKERFTFFFTKKYPFSNHYPCRFVIDGKEFNCTEQYYMYMKAVHFGDQEKAEQILKSNDPKEMKTLGKGIRGFNHSEWDREHVGRRYMKEANLAKYKQDKHLRAELIGTKGTTLVETNPGDSRWGIGLSMDDPLARSRRTWRGQNWLGQILTEIREELMRKGSQ